MPTSVTMPRLGESVTEGTVTRWLKQVGDHVDADEPLLEVSTDKVDTEIPSPTSGTLLDIKVAEDETVEVGTELAVIGEGGEATAPAQDQAPAANASTEPASETAPPSEPAPQDVAAAAAPEEPTPPSAQSAPAPPVAASAPAPAAPSAPGAPSEPAAPSEPVGGTDSRQDAASGTYVTPLVRKLASENGVDLATVQGTGVGGRIRKSDVLAAAGKAPSAPSAPAVTPPASTQTATAAAPAPAAAAPQSAAAPSAAAPSAAVPASQAAKPAVAAGSVPQLQGRAEKMSRIRQVIASRMMESLHNSAQLTTVIEVDVTKIARLRAQAKKDFEAREGVKLSFLPFFAVAAIEALKAHPIVNSQVNVEAKEITYFDHVHLGIAVDTPRGLAVPVIHDASDLNLAGVARKIADLAERTRDNKVLPGELSGGTFTITNTGSRGALFDTPIINAPQSAILGTGAVVKRAVVISDSEIGETIAVRSMIYLAISYDHRIVDGADAARFLGTIKERLEAAEFEHDLGLA